MLDFLILYEHKARELENICLLKVELEYRGYSVEILNIRDLNRLRYLLWKKPKVLLTFALYDDQDFYGHVNSIVGHINKVVNLQWEQVLSKKELESDGLHNPKGKAAFAVHLCWGKETYNRLIAAGVKNALITGPIQIDFLRKDFDNYYYSKDEIKNMYNLGDNRILLYISSFVMANISEGSKKYLENRLGISVDDSIRNAYESKRDTLEWFKSLMNSSKDITVIYRPHPAEKNDEVLSELEKEYKNFKVISDFSVKQWIKISDDIFTWFSTSIVEVYFANKNCCVIRPQKIDESRDAVIYKGAKIIDNYQEFLKELEGLNVKSFPIDEKLIHDYYDVKEKPSYIRTCNLLEEVLNTRNYNLPNYIKYKTRFKDIYTLIIKKGILYFKITDKLWLFNYNDKVKKWLKEFKEHRIRCQKDIASVKDINLICDRIRTTLSNSTKK